MWSVAQPATQWNPTQPSGASRYEMDTTEDAAQAASAGWNNYAMTSPSTSPWNTPQQASAWAPIAQQPAAAAPAWTPAAPSAWSPTPQPSAWTPQPIAAWHPTPAPPIVQQQPSAWNPVAQQPAWTPQTVAAWNPVAPQQQQPAWSPVAPQQQQQPTAWNPTPQQQPSAWTPVAQQQQPAWTPVAQQQPQQQQVSAWNPGGWNPGGWNPPAAAPAVVINSGNAVTDSLYAMFGAASRDVADAAAIQKKYGAKTSRRKPGLANVQIPQFLDADPTEPTPFPFYLMAGKSFKPHQIFIVNWLWDVCFVPHLGIQGALLCADMGLGKTLSGIAFMQLYKYLWPPQQIRWPGLVVCPLNLAQPWLDSGREFFGRGFRFLIVHDNWHQAGFTASIRVQDLLQYDAIIMTYDSVIVSAKKHCAHETSAKTKSFSKLTAFTSYADAEGMQGHEVLMRIPWSTIISDESQIFASGKTLVKTLCALNGGPRICLSGTPIRNKSQDMYYQLHWLGYTGVDNPKHWNLSVYEAHQCNLRVLVMDYGLAQVELPPMHEHKIFVDFSPAERAQYDNILKSNMQAIDQMENGLAGVSFASILVLLTRLRQCCDSAYLITPEAKALQKCPETTQLPQDQPGAPWINCISGSAGIQSSKLSRMKDIFQQVLIPGRRKALIFSNWRSSLLIAKWALDPILTAAGYYCVLVDGKMPSDRFEELLSAFKYDERCLGLLMTYKKGSVSLSSFVLFMPHCVCAFLHIDDKLRANGLNIVAATGCICLDPWFSPAVHLQALRRCWRIGQTKEVDCWWLYANDTIESRILDICHGKTQLSNAFLHGQSEDADDMSTAEGGEDAGETDYEDGGKKQASTKLNIAMIKKLLRS